MKNDVCGALGTIGRPSHIDRRWHESLPSPLSSTTDGEKWQALEFEVFGSYLVAIKTSCQSARTRPETCRFLNWLGFAPRG